MTKFIYKGQSPHSHNDLYHYGRSKEDGAPGVGTGNWRRSGGGAFSGLLSKFKKKKDVTTFDNKPETTQNPQKKKQNKPLNKTTQKMFDDKFDPTKLDASNESDRKHYREVADLGLKALRNIDLKHGPHTDIELDKGWRSWFMYEDQTIGKPLIAHYISSGYSSDEVADLIDSVNNMKYSYDDPVVFNIKEGYNLKEFARACEEERDKEK